MTELLFVSSQKTRNESCQVMLAHLCVVIFLLFIRIIWDGVSVPQHLNSAAVISSESQYAVSKSRTEPERNPCRTRVRTTTSHPISDDAQTDRTQSPAEQPHRTDAPSTKISERQYASEINYHVIIPMHNRMLSICNVQKLILEIKCEEHRLQSCECREWNRGLNSCFDQEQRFALIIPRLAIHHDRGPNVHGAICALNTTSSGMKVRERC